MNVLQLCRYVQIQINEDTEWKYSRCQLFSVSQRPTWGGHPRHAAFWCCRTGQFAAMRAAKSGKFSADFRHNFRPATHYGMVIKR